MNRNSVQEERMWKLKSRLKAYLESTIKKPDYLDQVFHTQHYLGE
jgi:hypothetical protein